MKPPATLAIFVLFAAAAMAQVHGVPASVTSVRPGNSHPGTPASVTSLGPRGWQGRPSQFGTPPMRLPTTFSCFGGGIICAPTTYPPIDTGVRRHHHGGGYGYVYGYPYAPYYPAYGGYAVDYSTTMPSYGYAPAQPEPTIEEAEPPAPTIFERRATTRPYARDEARYDEDYRGPAAEPEAKSSDIGVGEQDTTILVFADGHQMDIHNYAIVGQMLFNLDGTGPFKVKLAELDLGATEKINDDNGVEFKLPR